MIERFETLKLWSLLMFMMMCLNLTTPQIKEKDGFYLFVLFCLFIELIKLFPTSYFSSHLAHRSFERKWIFENLGIDESLFTSCLNEG